MGIPVEIVSAGDIPNTLLDPHVTKGIILSGGPASVYEGGVPTIDKKIFKQNYL